MAGYFMNNNYIQAPVLPIAQSHASMTAQQQHSSDSIYTDSHVTISSSGTENILPTAIHSGMNYNHLHVPYSAGMPPMIMTTLSSVSPMSVGLGVTAPGSFTFTSPMRLSYISSSQSQTSPYEHFSMSRRTYAPGLGVSWQHTVPNQMPWSETSSTAVPPHFVGSVAYSSPENGSCRPTQMGEPVPSCSTPVRRPKRPASHTGCELPSKVYITEEKMTASMQELSINRHDMDEQCTLHQHVPLDGPAPINNNNNTALISSQSAIERSWQKFRELEDMLSDEQKEPETKDLTNTGFKVHVNTTVAESLLNAKPLLPKTVLQNMNKPCLQVVLWKPPVDKLREVVSENIHNNRQKHSTGKQKNSLHSGQICKTRSSVSSSSPMITHNSTSSSSQPDTARRSSMEFEEDDWEMEL